ncbi:MAG: DUF411 domain-containing protein [Hyphomonadaceae bacterium]|nr:DUF411 domain-containing protein [Hyphomonadaceae bacterium]
MTWVVERLASRRGVLRGAALGALVLAASCAAAEPVQALVVHRDPWCGCCHVWVAHMQQIARFEASVRDEADMPALKRRLGVPADLASCHTAEVAGFIIEGHVPAADVQRLLRERPRGVVGLATPGMPLGSPGMEQADGTSEAFDVFAFRADGSREVFTHHVARA